MSEENLEPMVTKHEQQIESLEKRVEVNETESKSLNRLTAVLEEQVRTTAEKDHEHAKVLDKINTNLGNLNSRFDHMEVRVNNLEKKDDQAMSTKSKIISTVIGGVILAIIIYFLGIN